MSNKPQRKIRVQIWLRPKILKRTDKLAKKAKISRSAYIEVQLA